VHVCAPLGPNVFGAALDAPVIGEARLAQLRERARAYIDHLASCLSERWDIAMTTVVLDGDAADTLYDHACSSGADLVVMTTHGYGPLGRAWMGSVADTLVRRLPMPLLLARPHAEALDVLEAVHERPFAHVLIPLDGSALAEEAIAPALALGQLMDVEYTLLETIEAPELSYASATPVAEPNQRVVQLWRASALAGIEQVAARMREHGVVVHTRVTYGQPAVTIIEYAREHAADLIALTTHGRSGAMRLLLGSVADKVVRGAGVPVLIQRSRQHDEDARAS
jgi:nucleotide-binding universal stress UspA family protein